MNHPVCLVLALVTGFVVAFLFHGCTKTEPLARIDGIVRSHVDTYLSGTGVSADLVRSNQMNSGFEYGDAEKTDWKSNIQWELIDHHDKNDLYRFKWIFSASGGTTVSNIKTVEYDGKKSVIVFQNEYEVISIEPGSVPLPKNAQQEIRPLIN
jgi:hypothetical protein